MVDLYGCTSRKEQYTGWRALPGAIVTPPPMSVEDAAKFMAGPIKVEVFLRSANLFRDRYRTLARELHPDRRNGQHTEEWATLQKAKSVLDSHFHRAEVK